MKILILLSLVAVAAATPSRYTQLKNARFEVKADQNLVEKATDLGLTTLLDLATTAGLADTIATEGPFTVFAPSNDAFSKLPTEDLDYLTNNVTALTEVLLFHLYDGNFDSSMITSELTIQSKLSNAMIRFNKYGEVVTATGSPISNADQMATNGIIHVIDRVMFPIPMDDIVGALSMMSKDFSTLLKAVKVAGLADALKGDGLTVFAPTNDAFAKIPKADLDNLLADTPALVKRLKYHVVSGTVYSAGLSNDDVVETLAGDSFTVSVTDDGVAIQDAASGAKVTEADKSVTNGVIHVIDTVLLPPQPAPTPVA